MFRAEWPEGIDGLSPNYFFNVVPFATWLKL